MELLDKIYPGRIKSLEEWMRKVDYQGGKQGSVLKDIEDLLNERKKSQGLVDGQPAAAE